MTSKNVDIASEYFQAVRTGDFPKVGELLDEGIVWHQPGANQFSGEHKGRDAVFQMLGSMLETSRGTFAIDKIHTLMANGDLVPATIHFSGRHDGASMSMDGVDLLRIADGKITEMWLFSGAPAAEDAFWG